MFSEKLFGFENFVTFRVFWSNYFATISATQHICLFESCKINLKPNLAKKKQKKQKAKKNNQIKK